MKSVRLYDKNYDFICELAKEIDPHAPNKTVVVNTIIGLVKQHWGMKTVDYYRDFKEEEND